MRRRELTVLAGTFIRYVCGGGAAALTLLAVLSALVELAGLNETLASAIAFATATIVNYSLQYYWVFGSSEHHGRTFARYIGVTLSMLAVNTLLFWWLVTGLGWWYLLAQVVTLGVVMILNFLLNNFFTFRTQDRGAGRRSFEALADGSRRVGREA
jgi:putative flippase GtrA